MKIRPFLFLAIAIVPAGAQITYDTIVSGSEYSSVQINSQGDIAYIATSSTGATSAWRLPAGTTTPQKLAGSGDTTSPFRTFSTDYSTLANGAPYRVEIAKVRDLDLGEDGNAAFITEFLIEPSEEPFRIRESNNSAIWTTGDGTIIDRTAPNEAPHIQCWLVARENMRAFHTFEDGSQSSGSRDNDYFYEEFSAPKVGSEGQVTFTARARDWRLINPPDEFGTVRISGNWIYRRPTPANNFDPVTYSGQPPFIAISNTNSPESTGTLLNPTATPAPDLGDGIVSAMLHDAPVLQADSLWTASAGNLLPLAIAGNPSPIAGRNYFQFGNPATTASGNAAFWAGLDRDEAIFIRRSNDTFAAVVAGLPAPGFTGGATITSLSDPSMNVTGTTAFVAQVGNTPAIYIGSTPTALRLVARAGETAIGISDSHFENFGIPRINALGQLAFTAKFRQIDGSSTFGIWAMDQNGDLLRIANIGSTLTGKTLTDLSLSDFSDQGQLALNASFSDSTSSLVLATIAPAALQNFAAWAVANIPNSIDRGPLDDPDQDGNPNIIEFATGMNPVVTNHAFAPEIILVETPSGQPVMEATFPSLLPEAGVDFEVEVSTNLSEWSNNAEIVSATLLGGGMQEITVRRAPNSTQNTRRAYIRVSFSN